MTSDTIRLHRSLLPVLSLLAAALACGPSGGPERVLRAHLDATIKGDWETAYSYLSSSDQAARSLDDYREKVDESMASVFLANTTYEIAEVDPQGDTAEIQVDMTAPDLSGMLMDVVGIALKESLGGSSGGEEAKEELKKTLEEKQSEQPRVTKRESFTVRKEEDGWKVFLDWEKQDRIESLLAEAKELKKAKDLYAARDKYGAVLELDGEQTDARNAKAEIEEEIEAFEAKQAYRQNLVLYDLEARYYKTILEGDVPGVTFKIRNNGDKTLKKVKVKVYFKDDSGAVIAEEDYLPVLVSEFSLGDNKPLKPGYIWQMERGRYYQAESVPGEWKEGSVSAEITDLELE